VVGGGAGAVDRLCALGGRWPIDFRRIDAAGPLAAHLGAEEGEVVVVRPDAYVAAFLSDATLAGTEAALRAALALERDGETR
jgi:hypothetical protein